MIEEDAVDAKAAQTLSQLCDRSVRGTVEENYPTDEVTIPSSEQLLPGTDLSSMKELIAHGSNAAAVTSQLQTIAKVAAEAFKHHQEKLASGLGGLSAKAFMAALNQGSGFDARTGPGAAAIRMRYAKLGNS